MNIIQLKKLRDFININNISIDNDKFINNTSEPIKLPEKTIDNFVNFDLLMDMDLFNDTLICANKSTRRALRLLKLILIAKNDILNIDENYNVSINIAMIVTGEVVLYLNVKEIPGRSAKVEISTLNNCYQVSAPINEDIKAIFDDLVNKTSFGFN